MVMVTITDMDTVTAMGTNRTGKNRSLKSYLTEKPIIHREGKK